MSSLRFWVVLAVGLSLFLVAISLWAEKSQPSQSTIEIKQTLIDLGKVRVSETKEADFFLKNTGPKPLRLTNISSSCGCVTAKIMKADGWESAEFGMHAQSRSTIEILPNETATVRAVYRPSVMPVRGPVEREIYLSTSDPGQKRLTFKIKAQVYD